MLPNEDVRSHWLHEKTEACSKGGIVVARHPLSAEAGKEVLAKGGNAVDAAVAASLAGSIVQPMANTIGGGGVLVISRPTGESLALNYLYEAPARATADMFPLEAHAAPGLFGWSGVKDQMNEIGGLAAGIPGSIAGLHAAWKAHGRLPWRDVVEPAIGYAEKGFPIDWYGALMLATHADQMKAFPATARQFLRDGVYAYRPAVIDKADIHVQPALAQTLQAIAERGPDAFYNGQVAEDIERAVAAAKGRITARDLERYAVRSSQPAQVKYRGHALDYVPYGSPTLALFFNILACFDMPALAHDSVERYHLVTEALRRCWQYRDRFNGDTDVVEGPWIGLANPAFGAAVAATIDRQRVQPASTGIDPHDFGPATTGHGQRAGQPGKHEGTVHISAADSDGCMVALTETVVGNFGSLVTADCGVLLNNGMIGFSPIPGQMNSVAPGKRPSTNMSPTIVRDEQGRAIATVGASGGRKIIPAVVQILNLFLDNRLSMQAAVSHPRLDIEGTKVIADSRISMETLRRLEGMGHVVDVRTEDLSTFEFGNACGIALRDDGMLTSGVNPFQLTMARGI